MRDFLVMIVIATLLMGGALVWQTLNPPPRADYEIYYFGSPTCGACKAWKRTDLVEWRRDPASSAAPLHIADLSHGRADPWQGGYGRHQEVFLEAFGDRRRISWPSFVLMDGGRVKRVRTGLSGWDRIAREVRREHRRRQKRAARAAG
jgi:hypothetical protein